MSQKAIREYDAKKLLFSNDLKTPLKMVSVTEHTNIEKLSEHHPWLLSQKLVCKPDQLIKRRGKLGLVKLNSSFEEVSLWLKEKMNTSVTVEHVQGKLTQFIIEPFVPHQQIEEHYLCITSQRDGDLILFYSQGGVDIGDVDSKADSLLVPTGQTEPSIDDLLKLTSSLLNRKDEHVQMYQRQVVSFIQNLYQKFKLLFFSYLEINPFVVVDPQTIISLDTAAKLDQTAFYLMRDTWGYIEFPTPFGTTKSKAEKFIEMLDSKTGASLKLTVLNPQGRIWTMIAGGGASVVFTDTIVDLGFGKDLANYGEYSGDPSEQETYQYAKTILELITEGEPIEPDGKILIIGGGIANFTNVAETFNGIIMAITEFSEQLKRHKLKIFVRRGGPNYAEGLKLMYELGQRLSIPIEVFGPEVHITYIVSLALGKVSSELKPKTFIKSFSQEDLLTLTDTYSRPPSSSRSGINNTDNLQNDMQQSTNPLKSYQLFDRNSTCLVYGLQLKAVQGMLDFDYICKRKEKSVAAIVYPFTGNHYQKVYWGTQETLLPIYEKVSDALKKYPKVDTVVNFASCRSVFPSTKEILNFSDQVKKIAIIAEGVPENFTRLLNHEARQKGVTIIGPATVGGIFPGAFKIGNTGGMIDNIIASKLYRPGSVAYVSKSGGMSNELNNIINRNSDGVAEGIAIGGDKYPGSSFLDHFLRYEQNPRVKLLVLLGEVGGVEEYDIVQALKNKKIKKPVVAWCVGTCAKIFPYTIQFGHAGSSANSQMETADAKNRALREAGALVPTSFEEFGSLINQVYQQLLSEGALQPLEEPPVPKIPMDFSWAMRLGLIRKPSSFTSSISDDRGEELLYSGMTISNVIESGIGIGGTIGLLWFKKKLPSYFCRFIEMILVIVSDHGPAVSGAHNTIVTARAGKDLISSITSGLMTIGPRFGGALDAAALQFSTAYDAGLSPFEFVEKMKKENQLIMGIGHKIKSLQNPDKRVELIKSYIKKNFNKAPLLDYALEVEKVTTSKKSNLILNVDGVVAVCFVDLLRDSGVFTKAEAQEYINLGCLNGLFVLGRTIGFIGHYIDQKRLKQDLYRHPYDDINYLKADDDDLQE